MAGWVQRPGPLARRAFALAWHMLGKVIELGEGEWEQNDAEARMLSCEMSRIFGEMGFYQI